MIEPLAPSAYRDLVRRALEEDFGGTLSVDADLTSAAVIPSGQCARGAFLVKSPCVVAGLAVACEAFRLLEADVLVEERRHDGDLAAAGDVVALVTGRARTLLAGERTALNFLQRLSGIATLARRFVDAAGGRVVVLDTRKTTPTLRALEKYAVRAGGAVNHRAGLHEAILIKDNHVRLAGGVAEAVRRVRSARPGSPVEVEAGSLAEVEEALGAGAERILVDNFTPEEARTAVALARGRAAVEISGGVTLERMPAFAAAGADFVSVGALTHSAPSVDISLEIAPL